MGFFNRRSRKDIPGDSPEYRQLADQSLEELRLKTAAHDGVWRLGECDWRVDQDAGTITFIHPNGIVATCPVQIIGTYNIEDGTWLWVWDNPSIVPALQEAANRVRGYGQQHNINRLTTG
jgi:hypothetical protein